MTFFVSLYFMGVLASLIHIWLLPKQSKNKKNIIEVLLLYQIVFSIGLTSFVSFIGLSTLRDFIAAYTGWPSCPFEQQLAHVNLGFAVLAFMGIRYRSYFWLATVIGFSIWIFADGLHHFYEYIYLKNDAPGNIGVPLYTDLIIPPILVWLTYEYFKTKDDKN